MATCHLHASPLTPIFGSAPTISPLTVDGQPACLIWPSEDAPSNFGLGSIAEVDVLMPAPAEGGYSILVITGDSRHIAAIAKGVTFS